MATSRRTYAQREADARAKQAAVKAEAEERARKAAEEAKAKQEADEKARREAEAKAKAEAEERARKAADEAKAKQEAAEKARREAEAKAMAEAEERARKATVAFKSVADNAHLSAEDLLASVERAAAALEDVAAANPELKVEIANMKVAAHFKVDAVKESIAALDIALADEKEIMTRVASTAKQLPRFTSMPLIHLEAVPQVPFQAAAEGLATLEAVQSAQALVEARSEYLPTGISKDSMCALSLLGSDVQTLHLMNETLTATERSENAAAWQLIRLIADAINELHDSDSETREVWTGASGDMRHLYPIGASPTWNTFGLVVTSMEEIENTRFFGEGATTSPPPSPPPSPPSTPASAGGKPPSLARMSSGLPASKTFFQIITKRSCDISPFVAQNSAGSEILMLPPGSSFTVVGHMKDGHGAIIIQMVDTLSPHCLIAPSTNEVPNDLNAPTKTFRVDRAIGPPPKDRTWKDEYPAARLEAVRMNGLEAGWSQEVIDRFTIEPYTTGSDTIEVWTKTYSAGVHPNHSMPVDEQVQCSIVNLLCSRALGRAFRDQSSEYMPRAPTICRIAFESKQLSSHATLLPLTPCHSSLVISLALVA